MHLFVFLSFFSLERSVRTSLTSGVLGRGASVGWWLLVVSASAAKDISRGELTMLRCALISSKVICYSSLCWAPATCRAVCLSVGNLWLLIGGTNLRKFLHALPRHYFLWWVEEAIWVKLCVWPIDDDLACWWQGTRNIANHVSKEALDLIWLDALGMIVRSISVIWEPRPGVMN